MKFFRYKITAAVLIMFFTVLPLFSQDETQETQEAAEEENLFQEVQGLETWTHEIDISDYKAGTYNIIIEGKDKAGNKFIEGPYNIYIDPDSDKPIVNISNPEPQMKVNGNLNIIGTCVDDDAVSAVEVKLDDGTFLRAVGTDFWSYYLETRDMEDGEHRVTARGIDENGLPGDEQTVAFVLDRAVPKTGITSIANGAIVNGKIVLEGQTSDLNGIEELELSTDGGVIFNRLSTKRNKEENYHSFKIKVNTMDLEDGPHIYWLRSTDGTGSVSLASFLFFVDNKPPELNIIYPSENDAVNGRFTIVGRAEDAIGIDRLTYSIKNEEPVEIPMSIGDPYWHQEVNFSGEEEADITFILYDKTGNTTEYRLQKLLDFEADKPVLELTSPLPGEVYSSPALSGFVTDDDGVDSVVYKLDSGEPVRVPAAYSFNIENEALGPGAHKLEIYAVDSEGLKGPVQKVEFSIALADPEIFIDSMIPAEEGSAVPFFQAAEINLLEYKSLEGSVAFNNQPESLFMSIDGAEAVKLSLKKNDDTLNRMFSIPLKNVLPGFHTVSLKAQDAGGGIAEQNFYLTVRDPAAPAATKKLFYTDSRFTSGGKPASDPVRMRKNDEIVFFIDGDRAKEAVLSQDIDFLKLKAEGSRVILKAAAPGFAEGISIEITSGGGKKHTVGPFTVGCDDEAPKLTLTADPNGTIVGGAFELAGQVADNLELASLEYSINGGGFNAVETVDGQFQKTVELGNAPDGGIEMLLKAEDRMGNLTQRIFLFRKDTMPPVLTQLAPHSSLSANGVISFVGRLKDESRIASVEYTSDGENYTPFDNSAYPAGSLDLTAGETEEGGAVKHQFRVVDDAGNSSGFDPSFRIDPEKDVPTVEIQIPEDDTLMTNDFVISGMAFDDDKISVLKYKVDGGEFIDVEAGNNFEIPFVLEALEDNGHTIEIVAVDPNGVESEADAVGINISRSEPVSVLNSPDIESIVRGVVVISGVSSDDNGIGDVSLSYDNGNTYNAAVVEPVADEADDEASAEADEEVSEDAPAVDTEVRWNYELDTELLEDGSHSLLLKAVDVYGVESLFTTLINIDNTPPVIELSEPEEGAEISETAELRGRLSDNIELHEVKMELQHLSEPEAVLSELLPDDEMLLQKLDLTDFPPGWINMRISAVDKTGNSVSVSRNILKKEVVDERKISILTPAKGAGITGDIIIQGRAVNFRGKAIARLYIDDSESSKVEIGKAGYFSLNLEHGAMPDGEHELSVRVTDETGDELSSDIVPVSYTELGPWIKIENFNTGDFANDRPWITGTAGYLFIEPQLEDKDLEKYRKERAVDIVEFSLDNGKTFARADGREEWQFRLETQELSMGDLWVLVRARYNDGSASVVKTMLVVDENPPRIELLAPGEGMRFNDTLRLVGIADDEYGLDSISAALRDGSKSSYEVPAFIQGLYIDAHFLGATYAELGVGLTFFDDNVKLQGLIGYAPPGRFSGMTLGMKLLANIAVVPWEYFLGYDFRNFSSSVALGTTFEYFSMPEDDGALFGEDGTVLGALVAQAELVKYSVPEWTMFSSYSLYTEMQFWFISSDVDAGIEPRLSFGLRTNVF